ncbi:MAG: RNA-binding S4 domain-containing protein [Firmicutes bacterium]|nr:RNA-binding S4 domain-containing protein [Bacillota bacterium]
MVFVREVIINTDAIQLDQFLKWARITATGGEAKRLIQGGMVKVNGQVETARSRKIQPGAVVEVSGETYLVRSEN